MATRKKATSPAPAPTIAVDDPEPDAIESEIPPPPKRRPGEKHVRRTTEEVFNVPVSAEDQDADDDDDTLDAEVVDTDLLPEKPKSALDNLLEQLTGDTAGLRVYVTRKEDSASTGLRFRNPCLVQRPVGSMDFREAFGVKMEVELAIQRRWGGGEYEIEIRRNGAYKTRWQTVIEDPPLDEIAGADNGNGKTPPSYVPTSPAPQKSLYAELKELRETSEILGWGPQRAAAAPDPASMLDSTFGLVTKVMEITKPFMPEPATAPPAPGANWKDMAIQLGPVLLGNPQVQNILGGIAYRLTAVPAAARPNPAFVVPPSGGMPHNGQPQFQPQPSPEQLAEAQFHEREAAKNKLMADFVRESIEGIKNNEFPEVAAKIAIQGAREFPEMLGEVIVQASATPEMTLQQFSTMSVMTGGPDLMQAPFALEWCQDMIEAILSHPMIKAAMTGVVANSEEEGSAVGAAPGGPSDTGLGEGIPAEMGVSQVAAAEPVFNLQPQAAEGDGGQESGAGEGLGENDYDFSDETVKDLYGGTDDDE